MNEFRVEHYIDGDDMQLTKLSDLNEKEMDQWKRDMEERALSQYYNKKVKVSDRKSDSKKRA